MEKKGLKSEFELHFGSLEHIGLMLDFINFFYLIFDSRLIDESYRVYWWDLKFVLMVTTVFAGSLYLKSLIIGFKNHVEVWFESFEYIGMI